MNSPRILLLGASGMVGTAVATVCERLAVSLTEIDHAELDIRDGAAVRAILDRLRPDAVINAVAIPSIEPCERRPQDAVALHCHAVEHLAEGCEKIGAIFVQPGTHAVFDGEKDGPYDESDTPKATGVYAATKLLSERIAASCCARHYIPRFPTLYGPRRNQGAGFVDKVLQWIEAGRTLRIADDKMDSPTYALDAAERVVRLVLEESPYGIYHVANPGWVSYYDFVCRIRELLGAKNPIERAKDRDFGSGVHKPLRTALASVRMPPMRDYREAIQDYLVSIKEPHED